MELIPRSLIRVILLIQKSRLLMVQLIAIQSIQRIVRRINYERKPIESHGGRLWAIGTPGRGATFHLTLPAAPQSPANIQC